MASQKSADKKTKQERLDNRPLYEEQGSDQEKDAQHRKLKYRRKDGARAKEERNKIELEQIVEVSTRNR